MLVLELILNLYITDFVSWYDEQNRVWYIYKFEFEIKVFHNKLTLLRKLLSSLAVLSKLRVNMKKKKTNDAT